MAPEETARIAESLGSDVVGTRTLGGGFSHETSLLTLADGAVVVARLGGSSPAVEAAVLAEARRCVPVPRVLCLLSGDTGARQAMVLEYVPGTPLSEVLAGGALDAADLGELGTEVGRAVAAVGAVTFDRPGFFSDEHLTLTEEPPWSRQLPEFAERCMATTPDERLDEATRTAWIDLCGANAPALTRVDDHARLVHSDANPKNILVTRVRRGWRVDAILDWESSFSGCAYADAANMLRFGADYPAGFADGFRTAFAEQGPEGDPRPDDWAYLGRVTDMFALSDLVTRPPGHPVADRAAVVIRNQVAHGIPDSG